MPKNPNHPAEEKRSAADYYKLHSQAVRDLAEANEENSPVVSKEELDKYRSKRGLRLSGTAKALLVKYWFYAAVCFFFIWGLGFYVKALLDLLVITGIGMGVITDLLLNHTLRNMAATRGENDRWMMLPQKGFATFPLNILYAFVVLFFVYMIYAVLNLLLIRITGAASGTTVLGVEPLLFGLFYLSVDLLFIRLKQLGQRMVSDARRHPGEGDL